MREGGYEIEGEKEGEKLNFGVYIISFTFIKVMTNVTHVSIYSIGFMNFIFISCESKRNISRICQRHLNIFPLDVTRIGVTLVHEKVIRHKNIPKEYSKNMSNASLHIP